jgi:hypothetical protein
MVNDWRHCEEIGNRNGVQGHRGPGGLGLADAGRRVLIISPSGLIIIWSLSPSVWAKQACKIAGRNITPGEWAKFIPDRGYREPGRAVGACVFSHDLGRLRPKSEWLTCCRFIVHSTRSTPEPLHMGGFGVSGLLRIVLDAKPRPWDVPRRRG